LFHHSWGKWSPRSNIGGWYLSIPWLQLGRKGTETVYTCDLCIKRIEKKKKNSPMKTFSCVNVMFSILISRKLVNPKV